MVFIYDRDGKWKQVAYHDQKHQRYEPSVLLTT